MARLSKDVAPFTGAWIEILEYLEGKQLPGVSHPSRVRGLKCRMKLKKSGK